MAFQEATEAGRRSIAAGADFSDGSGQFRFYQEDGTLAGAGEDVAGVLQDKPGTGEMGLVFVEGVSKVVAGAGVSGSNLVAGSPVASDASGEGVLAVTGNRVLGHLVQDEGTVSEPGRVVSVALGSFGILP